MPSIAALTQRKHHPPSSPLGDTYDTTHTHTHTSMAFFQGAALTARKTLEMLTPDSTHPQQAESSAKPTDTRSRSLDGLVMAAVNGAREALWSFSNPPLFALPGFELLLLLLLLLLHITHPHVRVAQQRLMGGGYRANESERLNVRFKIPYGSKSPFLRRDCCC